MKWQHWPKYEQQEELARQKELAIQERKSWLIGLGIGIATILFGLIIAFVC